MLRKRGDAHWEATCCSGKHWKSEESAKKILLSVLLFPFHKKNGERMISCNSVLVRTIICERHMITSLIHCQGYSIQFHWSYSFICCNSWAWERHWTCNAICIRSFILDFKIRTQLDINVKSRILGECDLSQWYQRDGSNFAHMRSNKKFGS